MQGWFYEKGGKSQLVIATGNRGKFVEIADLLKPFVSDIRPWNAFGVAKVEETGATYAENALIKARAAFQRSGRARGFATLADDSGFEVEALDGKPGLLSARWAEGQDQEQEQEQDQEQEQGGNNGTRDFARAIERVRCEMLARSYKESSARFVCALALVRSDGAERVVEGEVQGRVVFPPRGGRGFGYDPIFVPFVTGDDRTFGEMEREEKQCISHRAQAFRRLGEDCFAQEIRQEIG